MKQWNKLKNHVADWKANGCKTVRRQPKGYTQRLSNFGSVEDLMSGKTIKVMG